MTEKAETETLDLERNPEGQPWDDARCLTIWRCRTWGCGYVETLLRTACNSFGPNKPCPNCDTDPGSTARPWELLRHRNITPGEWPANEVTVAQLVATFHEGEEDS